MEPLQIELFADVVCPWCYLGSHRLERVLAEIDAPITVTHRPFLLRPDTPPGGIDIHAELKRRFGGDLEPVFARLTGEARKSDLELDLRRQPFAHPTLAAHTLLRHAAARGTQGALAKALYGAHFDAAKNIADPEVLAAIGAEHGFTADEVRTLIADPAELATTRREAEAASRAGVTGVPLFVIGGQALSGAQPESVLRQAIETALSVER